MRLLYLANSGSINSHKWINFFVNQGHTVCWVSLSPENPPEDKRISFHVLASPKGPIGWWVARRQVRAIIRDFAPDFVQVYSASIYGLLGWLSGFSKKVIAVCGSDVLLNKDRLIVGSLVRRILKDAILITTGAYHIIDVIRDMGVRCVPIELISFGVDTDKFLPQKTSDSFRAHHQIDGTYNVISTRHFDIIYDIPTFIRAAHHVHQSHPDVRFYLVGRGPEKQNLEALIAELGLENVIRFLGFVDNNDLPELLCAMDAYVSTSSSDGGIGISNAEAMACGVYTIISDVIDNDKWVIEGKTGSLFALGDDKALAAKIVAALALPKKTREIQTRQARQIIIDRDNYYNEMAKMERLLHRILAQ